MTAEPMERMKKYIRVLRRVNRVYLPTCKRPQKNKRLAEKLGRKLTSAYYRQHPAEPTTTASEPITTPSEGY